MLNLITQEFNPLEFNYIEKYKNQSLDEIVDTTIENLVENEVGMMQFYQIQLIMLKELLNIFHNFLLQFEKAIFELLSVMRKVRDDEIHFYLNFNGKQTIIY